MGARLIDWYLLASALALSLLVFNLSRHEGVFEHAARTVLISSTTKSLYSKSQELVGWLTRSMRVIPGVEECVEATHRVCQLTHLIYDGTPAKLRPQKKPSLTPRLLASCSSFAQEGSELPGGLVTAPSAVDEGCAGTASTDPSGPGLSARTSEDRGGGNSGSPSRRYYRLLGVGTTTNRNVSLEYCYPLADSVGCWVMIEGRPNRVVSISADQRSLKLSERCKENETKTVWLYEAREASVVGTAAQMLQLSLNVPALLTRWAQAVAPMPERTLFARQQLQSAALRLLTALSSSNPHAQQKLSHKTLLPLLCEAEEEGAARGARSGEPQDSMEGLPTVARNPSAIAGGTAADSAGLARSWLDAPPALCALELLRNNTEAVLEVDDDFVRRMVSCLAPSARAIPILQLLESLCTLNEVRPQLHSGSEPHMPAVRHVYRNRKLVLRALSERRSAMLLFNGEAGRDERAALLQQTRAGGASLAVRVQYHQQLLRLLLQCVSGRSAGSEVERADRTAAEKSFRCLVPLEELVGHALDHRQSGASECSDVQTYLLLSAHPCHFYPACFRSASRVHAPHPRGVSRRAAALSWLAAPQSCSQLA